MKSENKFNIGEIIVPTGNVYALTCKKNECVLKVIGCIDYYQNKKDITVEIVSINLKGRSDNSTYIGRIYDVESKHFESVRKPDL